MSSTNKTTNYNLSQFVGTDVPSYLGDYNSDMSKIDKAIGDVANSQGSVEQSVVGLTTEVQGLSTQVSGVSTRVQQLQTTVTQIDSAYKQADTALSQRITANANNIQANTTAIESANTAIESINTAIGTADISEIGDGTIKGAISNMTSSLENMFTSFDIPVAGTNITQYYANINTNIDKTKYKPLSLQYNSDKWPEKCFFTINTGNDINNVSISVGCVAENYTIPSDYAPLKLECININN